MKASLLKDLVKYLPDDEEVVLQMNHAGGGFSFCDFQLWQDGHIGYGGPIIMPSEPIEMDRPVSPSNEDLKDE